MVDTATAELAELTEDEVRERLAAGKLIEGLQHMSPEYLTGIRRILTVSADTELVSAPAYLRAARHAPALNNFGSAMSIIQDELGHAHFGVGPIVPPEHRGHGLGRALVGAVVDRRIRAGGVYLAQMDPEDRPSRGLAEALGAELVALWMYFAFPGTGASQVLRAL